MARKTKEEAEKTYQALLEAAVELFVDQGVATTTLNQISKKAGVTRGAFYWHFSDKSDVIKALWQTFTLPKLDPILARMIDLPKEGAADSFHQIIDDMIDLFLGDQKMGKALFIIMHNMEFSDKDEALLEYTCGQHQRFQKGTEEAFQHMARMDVLKPGMDPNHASLGFICLLQGLLNKHLLPFTEIDLDRDGRAILHLFIDSVMKDQVMDA